MPRMTVQWQQPAEQNGIIRKYRLVLNYTIDGRQTTITSETNNQTFSHSLDVFGGTQYSVEIWAETIKPGPTLTGTKQVPEYSKYLLFSFPLSVLFYQRSFEKMMCVNGIRKGNDKHWEAIQLWAASPRNEREIILLLKKPYNACKQETKEGEDSQAHFEVLLPRSIVFSEIYRVYWIYG